MEVSKNITLKEATFSQTAVNLGIDNIPNEEQLENMKLVAKVCFQPLREWYGKPIKINSFFRCAILNKKVGGSKTSQHCEGKAIDIDAGSKEENKKLFDWLKTNVQFDQLINEFDYSWVHVSFNLAKNRKQKLKAVKQNNKTIYLPEE